MQSDPRQFYYGHKRQHTVQTQTTLNQKSYARFAEVAPGQLRDRKDSAENEDDESGCLQRERGGWSWWRRSRRFATVGLHQRSERKFDGGRQIETLTKSCIVSQAGAAAKPMPNLLQLSRSTHPGQEPAVQVRSDFRSTILWLPDVKTDADGTATVKVKYPDSLTTWSATARVATTGNQFGIGSSSTRTKQPLIVRLQAPRFFVVGDQVTVSGVINNNTDEAMSVVPALNAEGLTVTGLIVDGKTVNSDRSPVEVKANSETRVDWLVAVNHASEAKLKVEARGSKYADAMEKTFTVFEHGIEKFISRSGKMRGDSVSVKLDIPKERRSDSTTLTVQIAPSMATTMLDALPYLIDYPYGCTEQTMSRFLPAVITAKTLRDLGLKPETAMHKIFGGIEESSAAATHPNGRRDLKELEKMTKQGLERLYDFQHADGGWGWWKEGESDHFMTAYVVWGMSLARQAGIDVKSEAMERAAAFLDKEIVEKEIRLRLAGVDAPFVGGVSRDAQAVGGKQVPAHSFHESVEQPRQAQRLHARFAGPGCSQLRLQRSSEDRSSRISKTASRSIRSLTLRSCSMARNRPIRPSWAPRTGVRMEFTGAGPMVALKRLRSRCALCSLSIRKTN